LISIVGLRIRTKHFVLDGEAVLLGVDGISDFDGLYSGTHNDKVQLYAFDILAQDGDDLRTLQRSSATIHDNPDCHLRC
jgi:bifunctional non-homologous end joining protein LigD